MSKLPKGHQYIHVILSYLCTEQGYQTLSHRQTPPSTYSTKPIVTHSHCLLMDLPESEGNSIILVVKEQFSHSCHLIALPSLPTAFGLAEILFHQVFRHFSKQEDIMSNCGPQFISQVRKNFMEKLGVTVSLLAITYRRIGKWRKSTRKWEDSWECFVLITKLSGPTFYLGQSMLRTLWHSATKLTPFQCYVTYYYCLFALWLPLPVPDLDLCLTIWYFCFLCLLNKLLTKFAFCLRPFLNPTPIATSNHGQLPVFHKKVFIILVFIQHTTKIYFPTCSWWRTAHELSLIPGTR